MWVRVDEHEELAYLWCCSTRHLDEDIVWLSRLYNSSVTNNAGIAALDKHLIGSWSAQWQSCKYINLTLNQISKIVRKSEQHFCDLRLSQIVATPQVQKY